MIREKVRRSIRPRLSRRRFTADLLPSPFALSQITTIAQTTKSRARHTSHASYAFTLHDFVSLSVRKLSFLFALPILDFPDLHMPRLGLLRSLPSFQPSDVISIQDPGPAASFVKLSILKCKKGRGNGGSCCMAQARAPRGSHASRMTGFFLRTSRRSASARFLWITTW